MATATMRHIWQCVLLLLVVLLRDQPVVGWNGPFLSRWRIRSRGVAQPGGSRTSAEIVQETALPSNKEAPLVRPQFWVSTETAHSIARSFVPSSFDPLLTGGHLQSILGFFLREQCAYVPRGNLAALVQQAATAVLPARFSTSANPDDDDEWFWDVRERIDTPDGDWFHADTKYSCQDELDDAAIGRPRTTTTTKPTVLLLHGLCSSSNSSLARDLGRAFTQHGMDCICLNFRGCSGTINDKLGGYHLGFTEDLRHFLKLQRFHSPVFLVGYSLGANVILKCLGELGDLAKMYHVAGAVALCAPLNQKRNAAVLAQPGLRRVYTRNLLELLIPMAKQQLHAFCNGNPQTSLFDYRGVVQANTITDFDEAFIAPVYGFHNATDYYEQTSSIHQLHRIVVPTLILNAADDPFLDPDVWPVERCCTVHHTSPIRLVRTQHGGHLGFCFHQVDGLRRVSLQQSPSWASMEAASFVGHVLSELTRIP